MLIPSNLLEGKKILLGVTGSIAAYKSLELLRLFIKAGAEVRVVMTPSAKKFVQPLSFEALSRNRVLDDTNESWADDFNHIKITQWADLMVIAPTSANTIAKLSNGIADTILTQCALAFSGKKLLAPSANTNMIHNPIIQTSIQNLALANYEFSSTQTKELACQVVGDGAMAEPQDIFWQSARLLLQNTFWENRRAIVTGGGTIERLDDVRYISNFSSGKMASAIAAALYLRGADVHLIATRTEENLPKSISTSKVESSSDMNAQLTASLHGVKIDPLQIPFLFMAAAVSDYIPSDPKKGKLKKEVLGSEWTIPMRQNIDIIASCDKTGIKTVAFKAETDTSVAHQNAKNLLEKKGVDAVCLNIINETNPFGSETNHIEFITADSIHTLTTDEKLSIALKLIDQASTL